MTPLGQQGARGPLNKNGNGRGMHPNSHNGSPGRKYSGASQKVLAYLKEHANTHVPYPEIMKALGATETHTVSNAIQHLRDKGINIERPMRGIAFYRTGPVAATVEEKVPQFPPPESTRRMWEEVGNVDRETVLIRDTDSDLWVARKVKEILT